VSGDSHTGTFGFIAAVAGCAVSLGVGVITATVLQVDALRTSSAAGQLPFYLLFLGTTIGILLTAVTAWALLGPIDSTYRRGGLALVCAFATVILMLICIPVHQLTGRSGLLVLLGLSAATAILQGRRARRWGAKA
jgi:hypothetical protein